MAPSKRAALQLDFESASLKLFHLNSAVLLTPFFSFSLKLKLPTDFCRSKFSEIGGRERKPQLLRNAEGESTPTESVQELRAVISEIRRQGEKKKWNFGGKNKVPACASPPAPLTDSTAPRAALESSPKESILHPKF